MKDKELSLDKIEVSHTLGGAWEGCIRYLMINQFHGSLWKERFRVSKILVQENKKRNDNQWSIPLISEKELMELMGTTMMLEYTGWKDSNQQSVFCHRRSLL
jgi:hypothetical protein